MRENFTFTLYSAYRVNFSGDREIIEKLRHDNIEAVADIFKAYYKNMYTFAAYMINDAEAAHDIVLDVLLRIWENRGGDIHASLKNYLITATRNKCVNYLNSLHIQDRNNLKWMQAHVASDTVDFIEDEEFRRDVEALAASLPDQCRNVFILRVLNGYSYKEIAEKLGISQSSVKVQLHRAGKKLRKKLPDIKNIYLLMAIIDCIVRAN